MSHAKSVTAALYNPLFNQVVSAAADSTVIVWKMVSGHRVMQFRVSEADLSESDTIEASTPCLNIDGTDELLHILELRDDYFFNRD